MNKFFLGLCLMAAMDVFAGFSFSTDFSVQDDVGAAYGIEIERISHYSHDHGRVMDGRYAILLSGNLHYISSPKLKDFTLESRWDLETMVTHEKQLGFDIHFRRDRGTGKGHVIRVLQTLDTKRFSISLDNREIAVRENNPPILTDQHLKLSVAGRIGKISVCGMVVEFELGDDAPAAGYVAFDGYGPVEQFYLRSVKLSSPDNISLEKVATYNFTLDNTQGFQLPVKYEVTLSKYSSGETLVQGALSGTQLDRPMEGRVITGGKEWGSFVERLTSPFIRFTSAEEERKIYFWNGMRGFSDPVMHAERLKRGQTTTPLPVWPCKFALTFHNFPDDFTIGAGYESAITSPWRFVEENRREQILTKDGKFIYDGPQLAGGNVGIRVESPKDKALVAKIPKDIPRYESALKFAQNQHFFYESEPVRFTVSLFFYDNQWDKSEIKFKPRFTNVYNRDFEGCGCKVTERSQELKAGNIRRVTYAVTPEKTPPCGVYKLRWNLCAGVQPDMPGEEIFEVLSDDPAGPCPPLASGLPTFVAMPNETKYLEQNAFDPWASFCGVGHYYSVDNRYPAVGNALEIWRMMPIYHRKWWCWNWARNSDKVDMYTDYNRDLIRHSDYFGGFDNRRQTYLPRYELGVASYYVADQLKLLRQYVAERKPALKLLTLERLDEYVKANRPISYNELKDVFDTCWRDFVEWVRPKIDAHTQEFTDYILSVNPKSGLATYGPYAFYVTRYKTAYTLTYSGYHIEKDPRVRENGGFWLFEEYHHSCDYPLFRASFFVATYDFHYGYGRRIFPEIYYSGWGRCLDGAVYMAHPLASTYLADTHQRKVAYQYVYGTPQFKQGSYKFWTDYGFHARNPEKSSMEQFVHAWGNIIENEPKKALRAPFVMLDFDALKRKGEFLEDKCNMKTLGGYLLGDICNTAEESLAYIYEQAVVNGYTTPVVSDFASLDAITPEEAEFVVLPPIVEGTSGAVLEAIRRLHARGVNLIASEEVVGLEDLFGVEKDPGAPRKVGYLKNESFSHKLSEAKYRPTTAEVSLFGAAGAGEKLDIPIVMLNKTKTGRTAFINVPPSVIYRESFRLVYHWGEDSLSETLKIACRDALKFIAPKPAVKSDYGLVSAARTEKGDIVAVISDEPRIYKDRTQYPVPVRFRISQKGIGKAKIESDGEFNVVSRADDEIVIRTSMSRDTAIFFKFNLL